MESHGLKPPTSTNSRCAATSHEGTAICMLDLDFDTLRRRGSPEHEIPKRTSLQVLCKWSWTGQASVLSAGSAAGGGCLQNQGASRKYLLSGQLVPCAAFEANHPLFFTWTQDPLMLVTSKVPSLFKHRSQVTTYRAETGAREDSSISPWPRWRLPGDSITSRCGPRCLCASNPGHVAPEVAAHFFTNLSLVLVALLGFSKLGS